MRIKNLPLRRSAIWQSGEIFTAIPSTENESGQIRLPAPSLSFFI